MIMTARRLLRRAGIPALVIVTLVTAWYVSPLYRTTKVWAAFRGIERLVVDAGAATFFEETHKASVIKKGGNAN